MEKFRFVTPSKEYEKQAIEFINEFIAHGSEIYGTGGLDRYIDDYSGWLKKLEEARHRVPDEEKVPGETFFLMRQSDNRIVGMINIRLSLNEKPRNYGGHIGYSIRPSERRKGYNKINLYLRLLVCQKHDIKEVLLDCGKHNLASARTMQALGGKLVREYFDDVYSHCIVQDYIIDVDKAIDTYKDIYEPYIINQPGGFIE